MRLIKCYVENFGMLSGYSCDFSRGLNCIFSKNSTGKTTLTVFIRAMLYGLSDTRKSDLDENDRKKYMPWQGGFFGGSLSLEVGGRRYTIERKFGEKPSQDKFCLRNFDTGAVCYDYSENFGEEVFGIDKDGFSKTVFLSECDRESRKGYTSISAKLSDTGADVTAHGEYERAQAMLDDLRRYYVKRGGGGEISRAEARLDFLNRELDRLTAIQASLPEEAREIALIRDSVQKLEEKRAELTESISRESVLSGERDRLAELRRAEARERISLSAAEEFFGGRIPTAEEIDRVRDASMEARRLLSESVAEPSAEERERMRDSYRGRLTKDELYDMQSALERLERTEAHIEDIKSGNDADSQKMAELYPDGTQSSPQRSGKRKIGFLRRVWYTLYVILGVGLGVFGVYFGALVNSLFYLASAIGAAAVVYGAVMLAISAAKSGSEKSSGISDRNARLRAYNEAKDRREREYLQLCEEKQTLEMRIDGFLSRFNLRGGAQRRESLRFISEDFVRYLDTVTEDDGRRAERKHRAEESERQVQEFLSKYKTTAADPFSEIRARLTEYEYNRAMLDRTEKERKALEARLGSDSTSLPFGERGIIDSIKELDLRLTKARGELTLKEQLHRERELEAEKYDEVASQVSACRQTLEEQTKKLTVIQKTAELLREASEKMSLRYLDKTKERLEYYRGLLGDIPRDVNIDTDFTLTKNERGAARVKESYSRGIKELEALALQLSLCDSLYDRDMPFLVLDDPFISFDDDKCEMGKRMLAEMSRDRQILYFTCSKSRAF